MKIILAICTFLCTAIATAQEFPVRPVTLVVPFAAGGPIDFVARQLAIPMSKSLGQPVIVDNRPSSGGIVGIGSVVRADPNGYTLLIHNLGISTLPALSRTFKFDPTTDLDPIGQVADVPMLLLGRKDLAASDFGALRTYIAKNQKQINLASAGIGTPSYLCGLLLMSRLQAPMTTVPYKGAGPAMLDLQGGNVDLLCDQITVALQPVLAGRIKTFGTASKNRLPSLSQVPTLSEQGLADFEVSVWHGIYAPRHLPPAIGSRLVKALQDAVADPTFQRNLQDFGAAPVSRERVTPEGLATHLRSEMARWTPLIRQAGAYID